MVREVTFTKDGEQVRVPASELELNQMIIDGKWGEQRIHSDLYSKLKVPERVYARAGTKWIRDGKEVTLEHDEVFDIDEFLWAELSFYTRDMRLGNLDKKDYLRAKHYLLLAADLLRLRFREAFIVALNRVIVLLELSQSKDGFLRQWFSTIRKIDAKQDISSTPSLFIPKKDKGGFNG